MWVLVTQFNTRTLISERGSKLVIVLDFVSRKLEFDRGKQHTHRRGGEVLRTTRTMGYSFLILNAYIEKTNSFNTAILFVTTRISRYVLKEIKVLVPLSDGEKPGYFRSPGFGLNPGFEINYPGFSGLC